MEDTISVPNEPQIERVAYGLYKIKDSITHGWDHTERVASYAQIIARKSCPQYLEDVTIAAFFHDIGRIDDSKGPIHAIEGAKIVQSVVPEFWPNSQIESIIFAVRHHADRAAPNRKFPTTGNYEDLMGERIIPEIVASVWDADRLDLARFPHKIPINIEYLSTKWGKEFANSVEHLRPYKEVHEVNSLEYKRKEQK